MTMSVVTSVSTVGSKKVLPWSALAAGDDLGALLDGVGDVRLDLLDRLHVDQRPDHRTGLEPVGDLHRAGGLREALGECVIDAVLHQNALGTHTGLTGMPVFRRDRALDRHLDVSVVEDDEWRVADQFERKLLDCAGALHHRQLAVEPVRVSLSMIRPLGTRGGALTDI